jgi:hypothetical protein
MGRRRCEGDDGVDMVAVWKDDDGGNTPPCIVIIINIFNIFQLLKLPHTTFQQK